MNRQAEIEELDRALAPLQSPEGSGPPATVVVLTGSAGVGKTALAVHWSHRIREQFPDGQIYANLRGYDVGEPLSAAAVLDRVLRDLGLPAHLIPAELDARAGVFRSLVADRRVLILLDNAATVGQVRPFIPGAPGPLVLITSRNWLPGLVVRDGAQRIQVDILREADAVALLREVTRTSPRRDDPAELVELARLCARLPLALRIAAERAISRPTMQLAELIADLRDDSALWEALSVGDEVEGEAVRTVFAWSYRSLPEEAARMFRLLGLCPGGDIGLPAAAAAAGLAPRSARRALDNLLGAFLIESIRPGRYQLHDLLRAYALDQARSIDSVAERRAALDRILSWYISTADHACRLLSPGDRFVLEPALPAGAEPEPFATAFAAFDWFASERANLVAAAGSAQAAGLHLRAWQLALVLSPIHMQHFTFDDWAAMSEVAVAAAESMTEPAALATALENRGQYLFRRRLLAEAEAVHSRARAVREQLGDRHAVARSLNALGLIGLRTRRLDAAATSFSAATETFRALSDRRWEGLTRSNLAEVQLERGDAAAAIDLLRPLVRFFEELGDIAAVGNTCWLLAWADRLQNDLGSARSIIDRALAIADEAQNRMWEGFWLIEAARIELADGQRDEAMKCCQTAGSLQRQIGDRSREAMVFECTGEILRAGGELSEAVAFQLQAVRVHRDLGDAWQEVLALLELGRCQVGLGRDDEARPHWVRALSLLQPFPDPQATRLRRELQEHLA